MFVKKIVRAVLAAVMVVAFCGCDLWMNDWKGYLEYWSEAVMMGRVEVSGATFQTNDAGVQTLPLDATAKISGYVINPQGHALVENSIEINEPTLDGSATKNVADPTLISVLLENVTVAEHTTFTVNFTPERADNGIASTETMSVTLQYNTPPAAPVRINQKIADDGSRSYVVVNEGELWTVAQDGYLYWAWDDSETDKTSPKHAEYFVVAGSRKSLSECKVDPVTKVGNRSLFRWSTGNTRVTLAAEDEVGVSSPAITSGSVVPAGSDVTGPGEVTGIAIVNNNLEPVITWINPSDSDFDRTEITCSDSTVGITINGNTATFTGIVSGKKYDFTFTTYDLIGNVGQSITESLTWNTLTLDAVIGTGFIKDGVAVSNPNATVTKLVFWFKSGENIPLAEYIQYKPSVAGAQFTWWKNPVTGNEVTSSDSVKLDKAYILYANYSTVDVTHAKTYVTALKDTKDASSPSSPYNIAIVGSMTNDQLKELGSVLNLSSTGSPSAFFNLDLTGTTGLTDIPKDTFHWAKGLITVSLPNTISSIGENAFRASGITSIDLSKLPIKELDGNFDVCRDLVELILPDTITDLGNSTFRFCEKLKNVTLPNTVKYIGMYTFHGCESLEWIKIQSSTPPGIRGNGQNYSFEKCNNLKIVYIVSGSRSAYDSNSTWKSVIENPDNHLELIEY